MLNPDRLADPPALLPAAAPAHPHPHLHALIERGRARGPIVVAVAFPCDGATIEAVHAAAWSGLVRPLLVGPRWRIEVASAQAGLAIDDFTLHDTPDDARLAAARAVALCRDGEADALMK